ncbi:MAG: DMT family transporter [Methanomassiliicoccales archaeon]|jgi:DME family drug/metabolite transporter|nr:DMT family transporter [Methanomassiliicoccales archaeon]
MPVFKAASIGEGELTRNGAIALTFLSSMLFATSYVAIKVGVERNNPFLFEAIVIGIGGLIAILYALIRGSFTLQVFRRWEVWAAMVVGAVSISLEFIGMTMTNASKGALIIGSTVVFVAPMSALLLGERINRTGIFGITVGIVGLVSLTTGWDLSKLLEGEFLGDAMLIGSAASGALIWILTKSAMRHLSHDQWVFGVYCVYPIPLFLLSAVTVDDFTIDPGSIPLLLYVGVLCTSIPSLLWAKGLTKISATTSATIVLSESVFGTVLGCLLLGETLDFSGLIGATMIFAAIYVASRGEKTTEEVEPREDSLDSRRRTASQLNV